MREPMSDLDRLVEQLGRYGDCPCEPCTLAREARATITRLREALGTAAWQFESAAKTFARHPDLAGLAPSMTGAATSARQALGGEHG